MRGQNHDFFRLAATERAMKISERLAELFSAPVGIHYPNERAAQRPRGVCHDEGLCRVSQSGQRGAGKSAAEGFQRSFHSGQTANPSKQLGNDRKNHRGSCRMRAISAEVE